MDELGVGQRQRAVGVDEQMVVRRRDEDRMRAKVVALPRFLHLELRPPAQDFCDEAAVPRVEVVDDHERRRKSGRQRAQDTAERIQAARRGGQGNNLEGPVLAQRLRCLARCVPDLRRDDARPSGSTPASMILLIVDVRPRRVPLRPAHLTQESCVPRRGFHDEITAARSCARTRSPRGPTRSGGVSSSAP